jgi:hypothetical protein
MLSFLVVDWALHPELIPIEVGCTILEPVKPFVECKPPLFLRASEIIDSKCDTLQFRVFILILEIHDFNVPKNSEGESSSESDSSRGDYPGYDPDHGNLNPWPRVYRIDTSRSSSHDLCLLLLSREGGVPLGPWWQSVAWRLVMHSALPR